MKTFAYANPNTLRDSLALLDRETGDGQSMPLAGGTDLLPLMKVDTIAPLRLVNIKRTPELAPGIVETAAGVTIGALTTLDEIANAPVIRKRFPLLAEAAVSAASPQLRNMATLGGNMLQRPRCWYFRNPRLTCWLQGGDTCYARDGENQHHAVFGESPCVAVHPSDLAPALLALDAGVRLASARGERALPLADVFAEPDETERRETRLAPDELIVGFDLPAPAAGSRGTYRKAMDRAAWAFALASVAVQLQVTGDRIDAARIVLGGVAPIPWRVAAAETALVGGALTPERIDAVIAAALSGAHPLAKNGYKLPLLRGLLRAALMDLTTPVR